MFSKALQIELPEIEEKLRQEWRPDPTFAATIGDGEITVWSRKACWLRAWRGDRRRSMRVLIAFPL